VREAAIRRSPTESSCHNSHATLITLSLSKSQWFSTEVSELLLEDTRNPSSPS